MSTLALTFRSLDDRVLGGGPGLERFISTDLIKLTLSRLTGWVILSYLVGLYIRFISDLVTFVAAGDYIFYLQFNCTTSSEF